MRVLLSQVCSQQNVLKTLIQTLVGQSGLLIQNTKLGCGKKLYVYRETELSTKVLCKVAFLQNEDVQECVFQGTYFQQMSAVRVSIKVYDTLITGESERAGCP